jgi:hypothetical protein
MPSTTTQSDHTDTPDGQTKPPDSSPTPPTCAKSYKQALLSEVEGAANRTGVDTFKLIHLIHSKGQHTATPGSSDEEDGNKEYQEDESMGSETTQNRANVQDWYTYRMRFQITLTETTKETYMEDLVRQVNQVLEVINLNTPGVKLAPWHKVSTSKEELREALSEDTMDAIKYLYGFKAGMSRPGTQYFRINLAIPSHFTPDDVERKNKDSIMIPGQQSLLKANTQSLHPVTIGWLLRSNPLMADVKELEQLLMVMWNVKGGFGLYWATVKSHQAYDPKNTIRAIHIETEEASAKRLITLAERVYGVPSTKIEDYPLGISMMFVKHYNLVQGTARDNIATLAMYQKTNEAMLTSAVWNGSLALDRSITPDRFESLRHWLMSLTSLVQKQKKDGTKYTDKLFQSIHRSKDTNETNFYFYRSNAKEAGNVISALPLVVKEELGLDPSCFFHKVDYDGIMDGTWIPSTREFKNKQTLNQEQYLQDLDECFLANKEFLPEVVVLESSRVEKEAAMKAMAMANGEDDVSVLSQLTDKTLKAAMSRGSRSSPSESTINSINSQQSGGTTKSKTQAAVKEALKDVSLQHNKAMKEQQDKFQKQIEELRKALADRTVVSPGTTMNNEPHTSTPEQAATNMAVIDSSDDEASMKRTPTRSAPSPARKRSKRGRGGRSSSSQKLNE